MRFVSPARTSLRTLLAAATLAAACSGGGDSTAPAKPANIVAGGGASLSATVGTALASSPTFTVTDASGNALGNVAVTVAITSGGGTLVNAPTKSSAGPTSIGTWTMGTTAGANTLTVTVAGLTPLTISATGNAGAPAKIVTSTGNAQTGLAGGAAPTPLTAAVQDQFGNGIPNTAVAFNVTAGGGTVSPSSATTNASGVTSAVTWTLGKKGGAQSVSATAGSFSTSFTATIQSSYPVTVRFFGPTMSTEAQAAFTNAAARIQAAIVGQISTVNLAGANLANCGVSGLTGTLQETTPGIIIYAAVSAIDGPGKILANAGPCFIRNSSLLPAVGVMQFDEADIQNYIATGRFESVVLHEMNHVVGFGTIWEDKRLIKTPAFDSAGTATGSLDPRFSGAQAISQCQAAGGSANHCALATGVAVELCGGLGTADGHWREMFTTNCTGTSNSPVGGTLAFDNELMTGYAEASGVAMPWSAMTIAQFQDLGYGVNLLAADQFSVPSLLTMARMRASREAQLLAGDEPREQLMRPKFIIGNGRIQAIKREEP